MKLYDSIKTLPGVGKVRESQLNKLGIYTVKDLLYHFPRAYQNRKDIKTLKQALDYGENCAMVLTVGSYPKNVVLPGNRMMTKFTAFDESGKITVSFFNQSYVKDIFKIGEAYRFWGRITGKNRTYFLSSPEFEPYSEKAVLLDYSPVYPLTDGITQKMMYNLTGLALMSADGYEDPIPEKIRHQFGIISLKDALINLHRPKNYDMLDIARKRFAFEELFVYSLCINFAKKNNSKIPRLPMNKVDIKPIVNKFGFELTDAQKRSVNEIYIDLVRGDRPMTRLLSGDVGSGKTVCAECAAYIALENGYQVCIMAPTEILANQHYNEMKAIFEDLGFSVELLTGSLTPSKKNAVREKIKIGNARLIVGTHALITDSTVFENLGLVITDEQHRFGVAQRAKLGEKAFGVHTLVMTATPIPRSLTLIIYGELSVSVIDTMPVGRIPVETYSINEARRGDLYKFMEEQVNMGRQIYVVCSSIGETSEDEKGEYLDVFFRMGDKPQSNRKKAVVHYEMLRKVFPKLRIGLLHGKMKASDKDKVMTMFSKGQIDILVSTTVIEVGVNVPNASVMVIEDADKFGLAALHQLRGRVGRGKYRSYCFLVSDTKEGTVARERLDVLKKSHNGYEIAEYDLKQRGPGDYFSSGGASIRQSGASTFNMAAMCEDMEMLTDAFSSAESIIKNDPELTLEENKIAKNYMLKLFEIKNNTVN
ncbi:MAG: ATP-dependent DNA helicase RecG [Ruminococcaceae bacterium]|nr:ATP-dependent DNA helicase RecG [Oscillospiraceae bacterium]